ncbi:hypothetical protein GJ496_000650, partial [Pomphorhynchus laevis]
LKYVTNVLVTNAKFEKLSSTKLKQSRKRNLSKMKQPSIFTEFESVISEFGSDSRRSDDSIYISPDKKNTVAKSVNYANKLSCRNDIHYLTSLRTELRNTHDIIQWLVDHSTEQKLFNDATIHKGIFDKLNEQNALIESDKLAKWMVAQMINKVLLCIDEKC